MNEFQDHTVCFAKCGKRCVATNYEKCPDHCGFYKTAEENIRQKEIAMDRIMQLPLPKIKRIFFNYYIDNNELKMRVRKLEQAAKKGKMEDDE